MNSPIKFTNDNALSKIIKLNYYKGTPTYNNHLSEFYCRNSPMKFTNKVHQ